MTLLTSESFRDKYQKYAYPLYTTFENALNTSTGEGAGMREARLRDTFEITLKYLSSVAVRQCLEDGLNNESMNVELARLNRPALGTYASLLRRVLDVYKHQNHPLIEILREFYSDRSLSDHAFEQMRVIAGVTNYPTPKNARTYKQLLDLLVVYRNHVAHESTPDRQELEHRTVALTVLLDTLFERLRPLLEMDLTSLDGDIWKWNGGSPIRQGAPPEEEERQKGHLYLEYPAGDNGKATLDLFPLFSALTESTSSAHADAGPHDDRGSDIYCFNGAKKSKIAYLKYQSGEKLIVTAGAAQFDDLNRAVSEVCKPVGEAGLPAHLRVFMEVSEESEANFSRAMAQL